MFSTTVLPSRVIHFRWGNVESVQMLLKYNAKVNNQNKINGATPIHSAVTSAKDQALARRVECVDLLLAKGADPMIGDLLGKKPIDYVEHVIATMMNSATVSESLQHWKRMRTLLEQAVPSSPIHDFIDNLDVQGIQQYPFDSILINERSKRDGLTPVFHAVTLLWNTIYETTTSSQGSNLTTAVVDLIEIVSILIKRGANLNQLNDRTNNDYDHLNEDSDEETKKVFEATALNEWVKRLCYRMNYSKSESDHPSKEIIIRIMQEKGWEDTSLLLTTGCDSLALLIFQNILLPHSNPNLPNTEKMTPLSKTLTTILMTKTNNTNGVRKLFILATMLVQWGGLLVGDMSPSPTVMSPLHEAARRGNLETIQFLLQHRLALNLDINEAGPQGLTPLHFASRSGKIAVAKELLEAGADLSKLDSMGKSPLDAAVTNSKLDMVQMLQHYAI
jgi:hypothetical protein